MRLAFFSEAFEPQVNGVVVTLARVAEYLESHGHEILFVIPRNRSRPPRANTVELSCIPFPLYPEMPIILPYSRFHRRQFARIEAFKPDLVHVWTPGVMAFFGQRWARQHGCPVVVSYETDIIRYLHYYGFGRFAPQLWGYLKWLHNNCQKTYVPSQDTKHFLEANGIHNVAVFARGVDVGLFNPSKRSATVREQLGIGAKDVLVLYVGRLSQEKNLPLLLNAAERLARKVPGTRMVVTGTGPLEQKLTRAFNKSGIVFTGVRRGEALSSLYASADLFALPSPTETLSLVTMEAMASGLPVLAMNAGGVRDFLMHEENSLLAESDKQFEEFLETLVTDSVLRARLGTSGRHCMELKTWTAAIATLVQGYEDIVSSSRRSA